MTDTNEAIQQGWLVDTKTLQLTSLIRFGKGFGYEFDYYTNVFYFDGHKDDVVFKACEVISLNTMVKLHDALWVRHVDANMWIPHDGGYHTCVSGQPLKLCSHSPFKVDYYTLVQAKAARIVKRVYLNGGKRAVSCYRNQVEFVDKLYEEQFLDPLIRDKQSKQLTEEDMRILIFGDSQ